MNFFSLVENSLVEWAKSPFPCGNWGNFFPLSLTTKGKKYMGLFLSVSVPEIILIFDLLRNKYYFYNY